MTDRYIRIRVDTKGAVKNARMLNNEVERIDDTAKKSTFQLSKLAVAISAVITAQSLRTLARYLDSWTNIQNKLRLVTRDTEQLTAVTDTLFEVAQRSRADLESTVTLYNRLTRSSKGLALTQGELASITETINKAFEVSGSTAQESTNAIIQLTQGLGAGALRGEEFNSVAEQAPIILDAVAEYTGRARGELKDFAAQGGITTNLLINALKSYRDEVEQSFGQTNATISQSSVILNNSFTRLIGTIDSLGGISGETSSLLADLTTYIDDINDSLSSGQFGAGFIENIKLINRELSASADLMLDNYSVNLAGLEYATSETTKFISDAFTNIIPNTTAFIKIMGVELGALVDKAKAAGLAIAQSLNVFDDVSVDQARGAFSDTLETINNARKAEITSIVNQRNEDVVTTQQAIANSELRIEQFRKERQARIGSAAGVTGGAGESTTPIGQTPIETQIEFFSAQQTLLNGDLAFWQEYNNNKLSIAQLTGQSILHNTEQVRMQAESIERAAQATTLGIASQTTQLIQQVFGKGTAIAKAAFIAQKGISAANSVIFGLEAGMRIRAQLGVAGEPLARAAEILGKVNAGLILATGFAGQGGGGSSGGLGASAASSPPQPITPVAPNAPEQAQAVDFGPLISELRRQDGVVSTAWVARMLEEIPNAQLILGGS